MTALALLPLGSCAKNRQKVEEKLLNNTVKTDRWPLTTTIFDSRDRDLHFSLLQQPENDMLEGQSFLLQFFTRQSLLSSS